MAGLEGTVKTPMGPMQKKTALYVVFGVAAVGGIVYWRGRSGGATAAAATTTTDAEIDPATGYAYGSAEDAAALAAQGNYVTPTPASGGGSSNIPTNGTGFTSNGAWSQAVIEYMNSTGAVEEITALSQALGKYLTGAYVVPGSNDDLLITQAIAVEGYPPVTGANGTPPGINRNPPNSTGGSGTTTTPPPVNNNPTLAAPTGLKATRVDKNGLAIDWNPVSGAIGYKTYANGKQIGNTVTYSNAYLYDLKAGTHYTITVYPVNKSNRNGKWATISVTTKK